MNEERKQYEYLYASQRLKYTHRYYPVYSNWLWFVEWLVVVVAAEVVAESEFEVVAEASVVVVVVVSLVVATDV